MATIVRPDTKKYASGGSSAAFKPPTGQVGIRDWLKGQGYGDSDISYSNGVVKLKNQAFTSANPLADQRTYDTADNLSKAMSAYRTNAYGNQLDNTLNTIGQKANAEPYQFKAYQPFSYNPDTDPTAQALRARYQQDAGRASNNAMIETGRRGIGNSSRTEDRVAQIQQQAATDYNATAIPALQQQAYQQYAADRGYNFDLQNANYGAQRNQLGDLNAYANALNGIRQQGIDNAYRDQAFGQQQKNDNMSAYLNMVDRTGNLGRGPSDNWGQLFDRSQYPNAPLTRDAQVDNRNFNYQVGRDKVADNQWERQFASQNDQWKQQFAENVRQNGLDDALRWASQNLNREQFDWSKDKNNPDNIYRNAQINALKDPTAKADDYYSTIDKMFLENAKDANGKSTGSKKVSDPKALAQYVLDLGLPDEEIDKIFAKYNIDPNSLGN